MNVTVGVWLAQTKSERLVCLKFAAWMTEKRWNKEKSATGKGS